VKPIRALTLAIAVTACARSGSTTGGVSDRVPSDSPTVVSPYLVIVPRSVAPRLLEQCTRHVPRGLEGTWSPTPQQARRVEELFTQRFDTATSCLTNFPPSDPPLRGSIDADRYGLQLGGVVLNGRRFIYVNGLVRYLIGIGHSGDSTWWRRNAVVACDGGSEFFGILYDPSADTLGYIDFNADVIGGAWLCDESRQPRRMPPHN
jgi:hypothetical protein